MKTRLLEQIKRLEEERTYLASQEELLENQRTLKVQKMAEEHFRDVLLQEDVISFSGYSLEFKRMQEGYSYPKDLFSISLRQNYGREDNDAFKGMSISTYSSSDGGEWELKRLITLGLVAEVLLCNTDWILEELNKIYQEYKTQISALSSARWRCGKEIDELKKRVELLNLSETYQKMQEGMEIPAKESGKYPRLRLSFNSETAPLTFAKVVNITKSKKTADLECIEFFKQWVDGDYIDVKQPTKYYKIRVTYIEEFIKSYLI